jgi:hypothetical protein
VPNIPGLPNTAIPNLGRGIPGGAAGLAGLPGGPPPSAIPGLPPIGALPRIANPPNASLQIPGPSLQNAVLHPANTSSLGHAKLRIDTALEVLDRVRRGRLEPSAAAKILDDLDPGEKQQLVRSVLNEHAKNGGPSPTPVLQALRYLPGAEGEGHQTQSYVGAGKGVGSAFMHDLAGSVTGIPAGIGVAGASVGKDVLAGDPTFSQTRKNVLDPIVQNYAHTYGPLARGDVGEFAHRVGQHPLGPVLDVAALASAGLGGVARSADALSAVRAGAVEDIAGQGAAGAARSGAYTVQPMKNGMWGVRQGNNYIAYNLPDKASAIKHAQSLSVRDDIGIGLRGPSAVRGTAGRAAQGFLRGGGERGRFLDAYQSSRFGRDYEDIHGPETDRAMKELQSVMDDPNLRLSKRSLKEVASEVKGDIGATRAASRSKVEDMLRADETAPFVKSRGIARGQVAAANTYREAMAVMKAGAIYLRPAYLPNNWAGNLFMNAVHQGPLAPINLAKSFMLDKHVGARYRAVIDKAMGENSASILRDPKNKGYVQSITDPLVRSLGAAADMPFRRSAWLHEARRQGYSSLSEVKGLMQKAQSGDQGAYKQIADIGRRASEEIVKFGKMTDKEQWIARNVIFIYSWLRGATRLAARFPAQHPIQSAMYQHLSNDIGNPYLTKNLGGVPAFMRGVVPVGHDKNGNPILVNPFALNPFGTALQVGQAAAGAIKVARGGSGSQAFDKFRDTDVANLLAPIPQAYLTAREGGKGMRTQLTQTFAPARLVHDLQHPGSGSIYPGTRTEALGRYIGGSMFPRVADQNALSRTLEREQRGDPVARMNLDRKQYKKLTGQDIPQQFVDSYKVDVQKWLDLKKYRDNYAAKHGHSGFRNLPPANQVDAALTFLENQGIMDSDQAKQMRTEASHMTNDAELKQLASDLWSSTGIGEVKTSWDQMMRDARGLRLSRARQ